MDIEESEMQAFKKSVLIENLRRGKILAIIIITFECLYAVTTVSTSILKVDERFHFSEYLLMYLIMILINIIYLLFIRFANPLLINTTSKIRNLEVVLVIYITLVMCWGSIVSLMDQKLYGQLIVFMINMITCSAIYYLDNKDILVPYISSTFIVFIGLPFFQSSKDVLIGHYVNSIFFIFVSWFTSRIVFGSYCNDFKNRKLMQLDKLKDEFLANTSHELRTPLNGIINITEALLKGTAGSLNQLQSDNLKMVVDSSRRLNNLISDILDISIIKNNQLKLDLKAVDVRSTTESVIYVLEHLIGEREIIFENNIPTDIQAALCDETRLYQILYNLLGNALKFTDNGQISINAEVTKGKLLISVKDTGVGIPKDKLDKIFNSFEQVDASINRKYEGTGLGLYITKELIKLHGGEIFVESEVSKGSCFSFTIPTSKERSQVNVEVSERYTDINELTISEIQPKSNLGNYNVLAVDDNAISLKALINNLNLDNYTVRGVSNGYVALELLDKGIKFDIVILDVMMPGISGYDVLKKIREKYLPVELPVLLLTARNSNEDRSIGFKLGANDYIAKPFEQEELRDRVNSLVYMKKAINRLVDSELAFLQAQIKPHFLYNTLSIISSLCIKEPAMAKELILDLSDYFRGSISLDNTDSFTTLRKELQLIRAYISIEKARFKDRLEVEFLFDEEIDCKIPALSIQPLVENSIRHGLMPLISGGKVTIKVQEEGDYIKISVSDNGIGIDEKSISNVLNGEEEKGNIGLRYINKRLITLYGTGLTIMRGAEKGTEIQFVIPRHN